MPGLGTFVGGARITGLLQMVLSQAGFSLALIWAIWAGGTWIRTGILSVQPGRMLWLGVGGSLVFLAALVWSLASSLRHLHRTGPSSP